MPELSQEIQTKLQKIWASYKEAIGAKADGRGINRNTLPMFRPHNAFLAFDSQAVHFVMSSANAMPGMTYTQMADLSPSGVVSRDSILNHCKTNLNYDNMSYVNIPRTLLDDDDSQSVQTQLDEIADSHLEEIVRQQSASRAF